MTMTYTRPDGRAVDQIRNTKITPNISPYAEGSALIEVGGTVINPGDIVVADLDGIVIVPRRAAQEVLNRCEKLVGTENRVRTAVKRGMTPLEAYERFGAF